MFEKHWAENLCRDVLGRCGDVSAEVYIMGQDAALTRFANNTIHQNVSEKNVQVFLRYLLGNQIGNATSNQITDKGLDELVAHAKENAESSPILDDSIGIMDSADYLSIEAYDHETALLTPKGRAEKVNYVCQQARARDLNASGAFQSGIKFVAFANTNGLFAHHLGTSADFQTVVMGSDASGRARSSSWKAEDISVETLSDQAIHKAELGLNPRKLDPGNFDIVVDPYVTQDLLSVLNVYGMGAMAVLEGRSWMSDRLGKRAMAKSINIWDDGLDTNGIPLPFDSEGVPKSRVDIVSNGVVKSPVYDRGSGRKVDQPSSGHAPPLTMPISMRSMGPIGFNLFLQPGDKTTQEMIRSMDRGLYITRFWYTRVVHPTECIVTGMTRDGVYMVVDGEISFPVKNLRFTQSYVEALDNVEFVGDSTMMLTSDYGEMQYNVPALKICDFNFTGSTV